MSMHAKRRPVALRMNGRAGLAALGMIRAVAAPGVVRVLQ